MRIKQLKLFDEQLGAVSAVSLRAMSGLGTTIGWLRAANSQLNSTTAGLVFRMLVRGHKVYYCESAGEVVGTISTRHNKIGELWVEPKHQMRGVGSALLRFAEDSLAQRGKGRVYVEACKSSRDFFTKQGYKEISKVPLGLDKHAYRMIKKLKEAKV